MGRWDPSLDRGICSLREGKFAAVLQQTGRPGAPFAIHISANVPPEEINQRLTLTRCMEFWTWHPARVAVVFGVMMMTERKEGRRDKASGREREQTMQRRREDDFPEHAHQPFFRTR